MPPRPFIFLPLMPLMLLSSCEPGDDGTGAGNGGARQRSILPGNTANPERIAAQESLGKPPPPRDLRGGIDDECPVHQEKMKLKEIPILFGEDVPAKQLLTAQFPFGAEKITSSGNALLPGQPLSARVYQCASCVTARKAAEEKLARTKAEK